MDEENCATASGDTYKNRSQGGNASAGNGDPMQDSDEKHRQSSEQRSSTKDGVSCVNSGHSSEVSSEFRQRREGVESIVYPPPSSIPLLLNNPHIMMGSESMDDPNTTKTMLKRLLLTLHFQFCNDQNCNSLFCSYMQEHRKNCKDSSCGQHDCQFLRLSWEHWSHCEEKMKCNFCGTFLRVMRTRFMA